MPVVFLLLTAMATNGDQAEATAEVMRQLWFPRGTVVAGDTGLSRLEENNPVAAEDWIRGERVLLLGRVTSIATGKAGGFVVDIGPRRSGIPTRAVRCDVAPIHRKRVSGLRRGDVAVFSGRGRSNSSHELHISACIPEFNFTDAEASLVARSAERCALDHLKPARADAWAKRVLEETASRRLPCSQPGLGIVVMCEHWKTGSPEERESVPVGDSCDRQEILNVLNSLLDDAEKPKTRSENGALLTVEPRKSSRLYDAMVKSGTLENLEP